MAAIGTASKILNSQQQMSVLDQTKTLAESALQMLYTAKEAGGNPKVYSFVYLFKDRTYRITLISLNPSEPHVQVLELE